MCLSRRAVVDLRAAARRSATARAGTAPIFADIPPGTPVVDPVVQALDPDRRGRRGDGHGGAAGPRRAGAQALRHRRPRRARRAARLMAARPARVLVPILLARALAGVVAVSRRAAPAGRGRRAAGAAAVLALRSSSRTRRASAASTGSAAGTPRRGVALGIAFAVDPLGAGLAAVQRRAGRRRARLRRAALRRSRRHLFHALMLLFLGRDDRVLPHRRPVQPVRVLRADERVGVRARRLRGAASGSPLEGALTSR